MAKLPGINYQTPSRNLGRHDIMGPIRVANAEAAALREIGGMYNAVEARIETNKVAKYSAAMSNEMAELNAMTKNTREYHPQFLDDLGIEYDAEGRELIPAHEVSVEVYKKMAEGIREKNSGNLSAKGQIVMDRTYASKYAPGITAVTAQKVKWSQEYATAETELEFEESVLKGNQEGAMIIADTARANGTWTHSYYATKVKAMPGRVQESLYLRDLDSMTEIDQLEEHQTEIANNPVLSATQANRMYGAYDSKIRRIEKVKEAATKEEKEENSSLEMMELGALIVEGEQLTGSEMYMEVSGMTRADRNTAMSIWRASQNKVATSDPMVMTQIGTMIRRTLLPDGTGTSFKMRRDQVQMQMDKMMEDGDLNIGDHRSFTADLKRVQKVPVEGPEYKMVEDDIYTLLTGGTKDQLPILEGGGDQVGLANTMWELNERALMMGTAFDPQAWWKQYKPTVISNTLEASMKEWEVSISYNEAVYEGPERTYDAETTTAGRTGRI